MRSLRFRLTLWFSLAVTLTAGTAALVGYFVVRKQMHDGIDFLLAAEIEEISHRMGAHPSRTPPEQLVATLHGHTEIDAPLFFFQIHRAGQGIVFRSRNLGDFTLPDLGDGGALARTVAMHDEALRVRATYLDTFQIQVATSLGQVEALLERYQQLLLLGLPVLFATSLAVGLLLSNVALAPVRAMQRSAQAISASNLSERLPVPAGKDEIAGLARLLNDLFARLEAAFEQVKRFTADASHELKTPLSLIRLHAERLASSPRLSDADRAEIESQCEEINRLNKLVESLLLLARADSGGLVLDTRLLDTRPFVREFAEDASTLAEDRGRRFVVAANEEGTARFDASMLRQVLLNLLSNAMRHTPEGGTIALSSRHREDGWELLLDDEGPGVPAEELGRIFGRFVRGAGPEDGEVPGSGLGLAIARSIVEAHAGSIDAGNRTGGGLRLTVRLPHHAPS